MSAQRVIMALIFATIGLLLLFGRFSGKARLRGSPFALKFDLAPDRPRLPADRMRRSNIRFAFKLGLATDRPVPDRPVSPLIQLWLRLLGFALLLFALLVLLIGP